MGEGRRCKRAKVMAREMERRGEGPRAEGEGTNKGTEGGGWQEGQPGWTC